MPVFHATIYQIGRYIAILTKDISSEKKNIILILFSFYGIKVLYALFVGCLQILRIRALQRLRYQK